MHEQALMNDLLRKILAVAEAEGGAPVVRVTVWLGALSHFTPDHFREHFVDDLFNRAAVADLFEAFGFDDGVGGLTFAVPQRLEHRLADLVADRAVADAHDQA
mgnify:CR=1 FL=1